SHSLLPCQTDPLCGQSYPAERVLLELAELVDRGLLLRSPLERDRDLSDPAAVDLDHVEAESVPRDVVADLGRAAELPKDEARDGVVVLDRDVRPEPLVEVVDRERAVDPDRVVVDLLDRLVRKVEL